jgi:hypothetical protein
MKLRLRLFIGIVIVLALVSNIFISGCGSKTTTTTPPTTTGAPTTITYQTVTAVTKPSPTLSAIAVTPASPANLTAGSTQPFTATGTYSDGSTGVLYSVTWNSDNPGVAKIDYNGLATGVAAGKANITASLSGITSPPVSLTVVAAPTTATPTTTTPAGTTPAGTTPATPTGPVFYISVSVDGKLLVAAQPVPYTENMTVDKALKAAHAVYYSGGESGYAAGVDPTFGVFIVNTCWGIKQIPFIILNDSPVPGPTVTTFDDVTPVAANDNIIICTASTQGAATPVSLTATISGNSVTLTATSWIFNPSNFTYTSAPLAKANVIDPTTGASLGTTDDNGQITITIPASGVVAIEGLAAINVKASAK